MLEKLEVKFGRFAIQGLPLYWVLFSAMVSGFALYFGSNLGIINETTLFSPDWWNVFFIPFRLSFSGGGADFYSWIFLFVSLYFQYMLSKMLEETIGSFRFNLYIFLGIFMVTGTRMLFPASDIDAGYLLLSVLLACAYVAPDLQILLMFIIPIKLKWVGIVSMGMVSAGAILGAVASGSIVPLLVLFLGTLNFTLFFLPAIIGSIMGRKIIARTKGKREPIQKQTEAVHCCAICGRTEETNPHLEFRYCNDCTDREYCMDHLRDHEHSRIA